MHGARLIMMAEPPRRQDLQQNPTIVLEVPQPTPQVKKGREDKKSKKKKSMKKPHPIEEIPNPYPISGNPSPPPPEPAVPPPEMSDESPETMPQTETQPPLPEPTPPTDAPPAKESLLQASTQSLSSTDRSGHLPVAPPQP